MTKKPTIGQQLDEKLNSIDRIEATVTEMKEDIKGLKDDIGNLKDDIGNLKDDIGNLKGDMRNLISAFNANTRSSQAALAAKGIPVKLTTAKASRAGKTTR